MKHLKLLLFLAVAAHLCGQLKSNKEMSKEVAVVRTAYAKLSYADEIRILTDMLSPKPDIDLWKADREAADQALKERLFFQLSNFQSGNVADIARKKFSDLVTLWDVGSDVLEANPSLWNYR